MTKGGANRASPVAMGQGRRNPEEELKDVPDAVINSGHSVKQAYMPINALNPFTNDWTIKARVVKK